MSVLVGSQTRLLVQGMGKHGTFHAIGCRDYGTKVVGGVTPGKGGTTVEGFPLFDTVEHYEFTCKYAEGFTMIVAGHLEGGIRFEGSDGWLFVSYQKMDAHDKSLLTSAIGPDEIHLYESSDHKGNFLDCIKSRSETVSPAEIAQRSVSVGHLGVIAITLGEKLKWDQAAERFTNSDQANKMLSRPMRSPWHL